MSILSEISRIQNNISNAYNVISSRGGTTPAFPTSDNLALAISTIPGSWVPTGTISISTNGTYDIYNYASADIDIKNYTDKLIDGTLETLINNKVTAIYNSAFNQFNNLTIASCPECSIVDQGAFYWCANLTTAKFPKCTTLGPKAFQDCGKLSDIDFTNCTSIGASAFYNCNSLLSVNFPVCTTVGIGAFFRCFTLTTASFPLCNTIGFSAFMQCSTLTTASFPLCTTIGYNAFTQCYSLTNTYFPMCTTIQYDAFANCSSLLSIDLSNITNIDFRAFINCTSLSIIKIGTSNCVLNYSNAFENTLITTSTGSIFVPAEYVDSYKVSNTWSLFSSRIFAI